MWLVHLGVNSQEVTHSAPFQDVREYALHLSQPWVRSRNAPRLLPGEQP